MSTFRRVFAVATSAAVLCLWLPGLAQAATHVGTTDGHASAHVRAHDESVGSSPYVTLQGRPTATSCSSATFCVMVDSHGNAFTYNGATWSAAVRVDGSGIGVKLDAVSCTPSEFCVAVDGLGQAFTETSGIWSGPVVVDPYGEGLLGVSCASATSCHAIDGVGKVFTFDGTWSAGTQVFESTPASLGNGSLSAISCPAASTFCAAVTGDETSTLSGSVWSAPVVVQGTRALDTVSCPTATLCLAGDELTSLLAVFDGATWTTTSTQQGVGSVSCSSSTSCLALSFDGLVSMGSGEDLSGWTTSRISFPFFLSDEPPPVFNSGSCGSATVCVVTDSDGGVATGSGTSWSPAQSVDLLNTATSVDCVTTTWCITGDADGGVATFDGTVWAPPVSVDPAGFGIAEVSCASTTFCAEVSDGGSASVLTGTTWSAPVQVIPGLFSTFWSVSCPAVGTCVAAGTQGIYTYASGTWTKTLSTGVTDEQTTIDCATATRCTAVTIDSQELSLVGGHWATTDFFLGNARVAGLSCLSVSWCFALGTDHVLYKVAGSTWTTVARITPAHPPWLDSMSCVSATSCVAVDVAGNVYTYNGAVWNPEGGIDANLLPALDFNPSGEGTTGTAVSCATITFCMTTDFLGAASELGGREPATASMVLSSTHVAVGAAVRATLHVAPATATGPVVISTPFFELPAACGHLSLSHGTASCVFHATRVGRFWLNGSYNGSASVGEAFSTRTLTVVRR